MHCAPPILFFTFLFPSDSLLPPLKYLPTTIYQFQTDTIVDLRSKIEVRSYGMETCLPHSKLPFQRSIGDTCPLSMSVRGERFTVCLPTALGLGLLRSVVTLEALAVALLDDLLSELIDGFSCAAKLGALFNVAMYWHFVYFTWCL